MKSKFNLLIFLFSVLLVGTLNAHKSECLWQNPSPQSNGLFDVISFDENNSLSFGVIAIDLISSDGSINREVIKYEANDEADLLHVHSVNYNDRWAVCEGGAILRTTNHGLTWSEQNAAYNLELGNREVPINTHNGLKPNEQQIEIIKSTIADDFLVNDDGGSADQSGPSISMDAVGNFVIVWYDFRNANWDIYYQRYNDAGLALGVNTKVNDDTQDASQEHPSISMDAAGNFVIVWDDYRNNNYDIYYQRYSSTGGALGVNTKVNDDVGTAKQWDPSISIDAAGNFVVVWIDERNVNRDIYYQRYSSTGGALGVNTKVNDDAENTDQISPAILFDVTGNFVIVWHDFRNNNWDIYYQRYNGTGGAVGVNTKVNDDSGSEFQMYPSISMDVVGNFVIVWHDFRNINWDIYFQRFTSTGSALGANIKVNDDAGSMHQKLPSISMDGVGNFVIVWQDNRYGQYNTDIIGQRYFANGNPNGGNYRIVPDGPNNGEISPVVCADNSSIIFSWVDNRRSEGWDIYAKIVSWDWNGVTTEVVERNSNPKGFSLFQNHPNPFSSVTNIRFSLSKFDQINLSVFNKFGQNVATLVNEKLSAGTYNYSFYDQNLPSGTYLFKLTTGSGYSQVKKMVLLK